MSESCFLALELNPSRVATPLKTSENFFIQDALRILRNEMHQLKFKIKMKDKDFRLPSSTHFVLQILVLQFYRRKVLIFTRN